jgi:uncharacterized FAD-dependent dehydrogenase
MDVAVVGTGPAGMAFAKKVGDLNIGTTFFDSGPRPENRFCPVLNAGNCLERDTCQVTSGFGGSSLLSGGKLSSLPAGDSLMDISDESLVKKYMSQSLRWFDEYLDIDHRNVDDELIEREKANYYDMGFDMDYYDAHIITNSESEIIQAYSEMLSDLNKSNLEFRFNSKVTQIERNENGQYLLHVDNGKNNYKCTANSVVLGVGIPGRELLGSVCKFPEVDAMESKLEVGVRIEFPSEYYPYINDVHKDLKLHYDDFRTFCVCNGGKIAPYYFDGISVLDGHVDTTKKTDLTNIGIRLRLSPHPTNSQVYNRIRERYLQLYDGVPVRQSYSSYISSRESAINYEKETSINYWQEGDINKIFLPGIGEELNNGVKEFVEKVIGRTEQISVYAPGLYYPGREFCIASDFSVGKKLYVIGEATGKFRGILQSFCSGMICGELINKGGD